MTPQEFAAAANISPEHLARLEAMDVVFMDWASRHNLVARSTLPDRWSRHYLDSAQVLPLIGDDVRSIVDLGSGAGFPGLVLAALLAERNVKVTLVESTGKKAAFLSAAGEAMALKNLKVLPARIEAVKLPKKPDLVTARALAQLPKLLEYAHGIAGQNTRFLFLKGQDVEVELTAAAKCWHMDVERHPSMTSPDGVVLAISRLAKRKSPRAK